eukprot:4047967-Amphidinium_carterae.1
MLVSTASSCKAMTSSAFTLPTPMFPNMESAANAANDRQGHAWDVILITHCDGTPHHIFRPIRKIRSKAEGLSDAPMSCEVWDYDACLVIPHAANKELQQGGTVLLCIVATGNFKP